MVREITRESNDGSVDAGATEALGPIFGGERLEK
jgi:hypothetical protein